MRETLDFSFECQSGKHGPPLNIPDEMAQARALSGTNGNANGNGAAYMNGGAKGNTSFKSNAAAAAVAESAENGVRAANGAGSGVGRAASRAERAAKKDALLEDLMIKVCGGHGLGLLVG